MQTVDKPAEEGFYLCGLKLSYFTHTHVEMGFPAHRQRPVDAGHLSLQPEQVHEEEDEEGDEEPQRHHLKVLKGRPVGPTPSTVDAQEGDEQRELEGKHSQRVRAM